MGICIRCTLPLTWYKDKYIVDIYELNEIQRLTYVIAGAHDHAVAERVASIKE